MCLEVLCTKLPFKQTQKVCGAPGRLCFHNAFVQATLKLLTRDDPSNSSLPIFLSPWQIYRLLWLWNKQLCYFNYQMEWSPSKLYITCARQPNSGKYKRSLCEYYSVLWHVKVAVSSTGCAFYLCSDRSQETLQESCESFSFHNNHDRENGPYPLQFWIWNVISNNSFLTKNT